MNRIFADTNAVVYYLQGYSCMKPYAEYEFAISEINEIELLSQTKDIKEDIKTKVFIDKSDVFPLNKRIKEITIDLRKKYKIKLPDAVVAATAIYYNLPLVTADHHFKKIEELQLEFITLEDLAES